LTGECLGLTYARGDGDAVNKTAVCEITNTSGVYPISGTITLRQTVSTILVLCKNGKGSPYSISEPTVLEAIPVLGSQHAGDVSHKPIGLCSYRVRGVDGICAEHLTVESYTVFICQQSYLLLLVFHHPLTLSFQA